MTARGPGHLQTFYGDRCIESTKNALRTVQGLVSELEQAIPALRGLYGGSDGGDSGVEAESSDKQDIDTRVGAALTELGVHLPELGDGLRRCKENLRRRRNCLRATRAFLGHTGRQKGQLELVLSEDYGQVDAVFLCEVSLTFFRAGSAFEAIIALADATRFPKKRVMGCQGVVGGEASGEQEPIRKSF